MRIRNLAIASVAVMAMAMPARADLILEFALAANQTTGTSATQAVLPVTTAAGLVNQAPGVASFPGLPALQPGGTVILQVSLRDTTVGSQDPATFPASSIPPTMIGTNNYNNPHWLADAGGLTDDTAQLFGLTSHEVRIRSVGPTPYNLFLPAPPPMTPPDPNSGNNTLRLSNAGFAFVAAG